MDDVAREAAAREIALAARAKRSRPSRLLVIAATIVSLACAVGLVLGLTHSSHASGGSLDATRRTTVPLDGAGVAVVEAGAQLAWHASAITQTRGEIFYRIGGALEITIRGQRVRAENACLRIVIGSPSIVTVEQGVAHIGDHAISAGDHQSLP